MGTVSQKLKYSRECVVSFTDGSNLASADLVVDGVCFSSLASKRDAQKEDALNTDPFVLQTTYGVTCPHKVNEQAPCGFSMYADALGEGMAGFRGIVTRADDAPSKQDESLFGRLFQCCVQPPKAGGELIDDYG